jgi:maltose alpha-D-glucosyltransferase/alpha-amylase
MGRFLTETSPFSHIVRLAGSIELRRADGSVLTLGLLQSYVEHQHNAWNFTVDYVERFLTDRLSPATTDTPPDDTQPATPHGFFLSLMQLLGQRTGELHRALSQTTGNAAFDPEPVSAADLARWSDEARERLTGVLNALEARCADLPPTAGDPCRQLLEHRQALLDRLAPQRLQGAAESGVKIRCHGDYNLGQLLLAQNDFLITDFEGNTAVPLEMRRRKTTPLHDVATMLGCFTYAAAVAVNHATQERPDDRHRLGPLAQAWERETAAAFLSGYHAACCETPTLFGEPEAARALLEFMRLDHLVGKLADELSTHPEWLPIPLFGILRLLDADATGETPTPYNE